jgi:hypothetical protein
VFSAEYVLKCLSCLNCLFCFPLIQLSYLLIRPIRRVIYLLLFPFICPIRPIRPSRPPPICLPPARTESQSQIPRVTGTKQPPNSYKEIKIKNTQNYTKYTSSIHIVLYAILEYTPHILPITAHNCTLKLHLNAPSTAHSLLTAPHSSPLHHLISNTPSHSRLTISQSRDNTTTIL